MNAEKERVLCEETAGGPEPVCGDRVGAGLLEEL